MIKASIANNVISTSIGREKVRMRLYMPGTSGMNHSGTMTGMCFLNFSLNRS